MLLIDDYDNGVENDCAQKCWKRRKGMKSGQGNAEGRKYKGHLILVNKIVFVVF